MENPERRPDGEPISVAVGDAEARRAVACGDVVSGFDPRAFMGRLRRVPRDGGARDGT